MKKKADSAMNQTLQALKEQGMPVVAVNFRDAVRNEGRFTVDDKVTERRAEMTLTSAGLLMEQEGRKPLLAPVANIKYMDMK